MLVPLLVITELLDIHEAGKFRSMYDAIMKGGISSIADPSLRVAAFEALDSLREIVAPIVEERRLRPGSDMISDLATASYDGEPYPTSEIIATVAFLLTAGIETVERALTSLLRHLTLDRDEWDRLGARIDDADYVLSLSAESLRLYPPVQGTIRRATETAEFHGVTVQPDDKLIVLIASANRDEDRFEAATEFRAERFLDNPDRQFTNAGDVLPFGAGRHHCAGSRLAGTEMVHSLQQLVRRAAWLEPQRAAARRRRAAPSLAAVSPRRHPRGARREGRDPRSRRDGLGLRRAPGARRSRRHPRRRLARAHGRRCGRRPRPAHAGRRERDRAACGRSTTRRCSSRSSS